MRSALYFGKVTHRRFLPFSHKFRYRIFSMLIDLDEVGAIALRSWIFSHNRLNIFSFHDRDHGPRDGTPLRAWVERHLERAGIGLGRGRVELLCMPRILGYQFNPLSVWLCWDDAGRLRAVLYEVHNTFGEALTYLVPQPPQKSVPVLRHSAAKCLHVSPFMDIDQAYEFQIHPPQERYALTIGLHSTGGLMLRAAQIGKRHAFTNRGLAYAFFAYPLVTLKVIAAIHFQALRLLMKGARYREKPQTPSQNVVIVENRRRRPCCDSTDATEGGAPPPAPEEQT